MAKVISFIGGDSGCGTTMVAQSFARVLSDKGKSVLFISGSGKTGDEYLGGNKSCSLDDFKAGIKSGQVQKEDVMQGIIREGNLSYLPAVRNWFTAKYYPENTFEVLLAELYEEFDYVVIDGGDNVNCSLTISAINVSDERFFVITQGQKSVARFLEMKQGVLVPLNIKGKVIVNMYRKDPTLFLIKDLKPVLAENQLYQIGHAPGGLQAEMESGTLLRYGAFSKGIAQLVEMFEQEPKKEFLWKKSFA